MNGISSTLKDEIKKNVEDKKREKFKFFIAIFISNIFVFFMMYTPEKNENKKLPSQKILHLNYQLVTIPIHSFIGAEKMEQAEIPITILSKDKKVVAQKAFLHQEIGKDEEKTHFKIEISNQDLNTLSAFLEEDMIAIPYVDKKNKVSVKKRGSKYEVNF